MQSKPYNACIENFPKAPGGPACASCLSNLGILSPCECYFNVLDAQTYPRKSVSSAGENFGRIPRASTISQLCFHYAQLTLPLTGDTQSFSNPSISPARTSSSLCNMAPSIPHKELGDGSQIPVVQSIQQHLHNDQQMTNNTVARLRHWYRMVQGRQIRALQPRGRRDLQGSHSSRISSSGLR